MAKLSELVTKVRSKNAGPFWLTIDIFCGSDRSYDMVASRLETKDVASLLQTPSQTIKRFDIPDLQVVKFSLPRPQVQGTLHDRDMHGAAVANLFLDLEI